MWLQFLILNKSFILNAKIKTQNFIQRKEKIEVRQNKRNKPTQQTQLILWQTFCKTQNAERTSDKETRK